MSYAVALSPGGHLSVELDDQAEPQLNAAVAARLAEAFAVSGGCGLELLASEFLHEALPPTFGFWRGLARRYFTNLCHNPNRDTVADLSVARPGENDWIALAESAPPMKGLEYLNSAVLARCWDELEVRTRSRIAQTAGGVAVYLKNCNPTWNAVGRVTFHLAENKRNPAYPFAFLATYTHRISEQGKVQHLPLGRALEEYAGAKNRAALSALLSPVQQAGGQSKLAREMLDSRAVFHPQVWRPEQAFAFLKDIPLFEQSGVVVRIPDWWKARRPPRPQVSVRIGEAGGNRLGAGSLLDFNISVSLEGEPLTGAELKANLQSTRGLVLLKGKWMEVDRDKLQEVLNHWQQVQSATDRGGVTLLEGLRLLSGFEGDKADEPETESARDGWSSVVTGEALRRVLEEMQQPGTSAESDPAPDLRAELRPYQKQGAHWGSGS